MLLKIYTVKKEGKTVFQNLDKLILENAKYAVKTSTTYPQAMMYSNLSLNKNVYEYAYKIEDHNIMSYLPF